MRSYGNALMTAYFTIYLVAGLKGDCGYPHQQSIYQHTIDNAVSADVIRVAWNRIYF